MKDLRPAGFNFTLDTPLSGKEIGDGREEKGRSSGEKKRGEKREGRVGDMTAKRVDWVRWDGKKSYGSVTAKLV